MSLALVILAAGMGSRFGGPKQLVPVGSAGETILDYNAYDAIAAGFERLVIVTRRELEARVAERMRAGAASRVDTAMVFQDVPSGRTKPWGTAEAVVAAADHIDGPFAVANADDLYGPSAFAGVAQFLRRDGASEGAVVGHPLRDTVPGRGQVNRALLAVTDEGAVTDVVETVGIERSATGLRVSGDRPRALTGDEWVSVNLWGLPGSVMNELRRAVEAFVAGGSAGEVYLPAVLADLVRAGGLAVRLITSSEPWAGMTNPEDVALVERAVAERWPAPLWRD